MAIVTSRDELKDYCLRRLGAPVIQINVDDDQLEDRIDDSLEKFHQYHYEAQELYYWKHTITQEDMDNRYLIVHPDIIGITRIFPLSDTLTKSNMFDLRYQMRLHELYDFTSTSYVNFSITMTHLRDLELMFTGEIPIRYQRYTKRLYIDTIWGSQYLDIGTTVVAEGYQKIDPEIYEDVWNDLFIKNYTTALFKKQWGENLSKFKNVPLPGGIVLNGGELKQEAIEEIAQLEKQLDAEFTIPPMFMMG